MTTEAAPLFFAMACNNAWANARLLRACEALGEDGFSAPRPSYFGSVAATANHLLTVDWFYVDALERALADEPPHPTAGEFFDPEVPHPSLAALAEAQQQVDRRLIALTRPLGPAEHRIVVRILRRHGESRDSVAGMLAHLFQHQVHHRGQIHALLSVAGLAPPQLDAFFCRGDAPARAEWLASEGLTEMDVQL
ncbi:MAG: DinB family protein [Sandaracinaceae bacterium]